MCLAVYSTIHVPGHQVSTHERRNLRSREAATYLSSKKHVTSGTQQLHSRITERINTLQNAWMTVHSHFSSVFPPVSFDKVTIRHENNWYLLCKCCQETEWKLKSIFLCILLTYVWHFIHMNIKSYSSYISSFRGGVDSKNLVNSCWMNNHNDISQWDRSIL